MRRMLTRRVQGRVTHPRIPSYFTDCTVYRAEPHTALSHHINDQAETINIPVSHTRTADANCESYRYTAIIIYYAIYAIWRAARRVLF